MRNTEILLNVLCLVVLEIFLAEGAKLSTKPVDSVTLCAKYQNEPMSAWSNLPKRCQVYLQSLEGDPTTPDPITQSPRVPLNIGEKELEIEVAGKVKNNLEKEKEFELEIESEVESESEDECRGSKCTTGGTNEKNGGANGNSSASFNQELFRTIALLGMATVTGVTIVVIAALVICLLRRRGESSQPAEGRKDNTRNVLRGQPNGAEEQPPIRNVPADSSHTDHPGRPHLPQYYDASTIPSSARGRHPHNGVPEYNTPGYSLVNETYASIDEQVTQRTSTGGRGDHYYFRLESKKEPFPPLSSDSSRWMPSSSERLSNPSDSLSRKTLPRSQELPQSCSGSNRSIGPPQSELTIQSQYDHLDHSGTHSRISNKESTGTSLRYDVLSRKE